MVMLKQLLIARYELLMRVRNRLSLPVYKGSTFRGGFGNTLKRIVCLETRRVVESCQDCSLKQTCVYSCIFETPPPADSGIKGKFLDVSHPFIIEPPETDQRIFEPGEVLTAGLVLIGRCIDYLPYFIYTFEEMGKYGIGKRAGKYQLEEVRGIYGSAESQQSQVIYSSQDRALKSIPPPDLLQEITTEPVFQDNNGLSSLILNFATPTRIKVDGHLTLNPPFDVLLKHLLERLSLLAHLHCDGQPDHDFSHLLAQARSITLEESQLTWADWERYSSRQDRRMKLGGFFGSIRYQGDISPFLPYLRAGQLLHVGKGTSFGLGKYDLVK